MATILLPTSSAVAPKLRRAYSNHHKLGLEAPLVQATSQEDGARSPRKAHPRLKSQLPQASSLLSRRRGRSKVLIVSQPLYDYMCPRQSMDGVDLHERVLHSEDGMHISERYTLSLSLRGRSTDVHVYSL